MIRERVTPEVLVPSASKYSTFRGAQSVQKLFKFCGHVPMKMKFSQCLRTKRIHVTSDVETDENSFHRSMKPVLVVALCFAQLPIIGISNTDVRSLQFRWLSWRMLYSVCTCLGLVFIAITILYKMLTQGADLLIISAFIFYVNMLVSRLFSLQLAMNWPKLMKEWSAVEMSMLSYGNPKKLGLRIKVITCIVMTTAAVQYSTELATRLVWASTCKRADQSLSEYYYTVITFSDAFSILWYDLWIGLILQILDLLASFTWSFLDLFIIVMSSALALRFRQVTARLRLVASKKSTHELVWKSLREDYNKLCKLCKSLDDVLSYIVLMSFTSNLFFILIQLFNSLRTMKNNLERLYFFFSFGNLILRTIFVSLYGAWINDESKRPIVILNSVSSTVYNSEIRRFIQQISFDTVALTGRHFFHVTRGLILSIAGAIVTYELVLIQFNENLLKESILNGTANNC